MTVTTGMSMTGKMSFGDAQDGADADQHDQQREHRERIGPAQRQSDDPHTLEGPILNADFHAEWPVFRRALPTYTPLTG